MSGIITLISGAPLDAEAALSHCSASGHGAADLFIGRVRDHNLGREVRAVSYDMHATLCLRVFEDIGREARDEWGKSLRLWLVHRHGRLAVGDASVIAAASSTHREEAFRACRYLIEQMKHRAPIWKQEHYTDGDSEWVQGHALCQHG
ncbi:molybdenum cofactor biosynthesis protein MoaE [Algiphilus aromaticivorans]|uniref:molybdenum cofactor biosynthesis protein MoaE n=1 Tax=Algiphilus aromaticivorans TaxID=382454 RepID=UPI0018DB88B6|nr:molybdenum cofactor biosynthesis protein MoaE [Algiphilus aromaticivorans]